MSQIKEIQIPKWQTTDGTICDTKQEAIDRQAILNNPGMRICPTCNFKRGYWSESEYSGDDGRVLIPGGWRTCQACDGKGYQQHRDVWK